MLELALILLATYALSYFLIRRIVRRIKNKGFLLTRGSNSLPAPSTQISKEFSPQEALQFLNLFYDYVAAGGKCTSDEIREIERSLPLDDSSGELLSKLSFLWQKAGMTNPKKGEP